MPVGAVVGAAAIGGGASLVGSSEVASASQQAAAEQVAAEQQAEATQVQEGNEASAALAPYNQVGTGAVNSLADLYGIPYAATGTGLSSTSANGVITPANVNAAKSSPGGSAVENAALANFTNTPDYQFAFQQGLQALQRSAAAGGTLISGGQEKAGEEFGQGLASQQYGNYFNRLLSLSQLGSGAATSTASNAINSGNAIAGTQSAIGQSQAAGTVGSATANAAGLSGVSSSVMNSLLLSRLGIGGSTTPTPAGTAPTSSLSSYSPVSSDINLLSGSGLGLSGGSL